MRGLGSRLLSPQGGPVTLRDVEEIIRWSYTWWGTYIHDICKPLESLSGQWSLDIALHLIRNPIRSQRAAASFVFSSKNLFKDVYEILVCCLATSDQDLVLVCDGANHINVKCCEASYNMFFLTKKLNSPSTTGGSKVHFLFCCRKWLNSNLDLMLSNTISASEPSCIF